MSSGKVYNRYRSRDHRIASTRYENPDVRLGERGMSIIRNVDPYQIDSTLQTLLIACGSLVLKHHGQETENPPGVNLIEVGEVKRQSAIGRVAIYDAMDNLYNNVTSLRRRVTVKPADITILGRRFSQNRVVAIAFDEVSTAMLEEERGEILDTLESLADLESEFSWSAYKRPHISLARVPAERSGDIGDDTLRTIAEALPPEIQLKRAAFYYPGQGR